MTFRTHESKVTLLVQDKRLDFPLGGLRRVGYFRVVTATLLAKLLQAVLREIWVAEIPM